MRKEIVERRHQIISRYETLVRDIAGLVSYKSLLHPRSRRPLEERIQVLNAGCELYGNSILKHLPPQVATGIDFSALGIDKIITRDPDPDATANIEERILQLWEVDDYAGSLVASLFPHIPTFTNPEAAEQPLSPIPEG